MPSIFAYLSVVTFCISVLLWRRHRSKTVRNLDLPPGPTPLPVLGNVFDIPMSQPWLAFASMSEKYGDIVYMRILNQPIIVLSSTEAIYELLEKRGSIYSGRPKGVMTHDLVGSEWVLALAGYGERWRRLRRVFHQYFGPLVLPEYEAIQTEVTQTFLKRLLDSPQEFLQHTRYITTSAIMKIIYGVDADENHEYVTTAEESVEKLSLAAEPGRWLVDVIPFLKHIPAWFPGVEFKRFAQELKILSHRVRDKPFYDRSGKAKDCIVTQILDSSTAAPDSVIQEEIARDALGVAFAAAVDTTVASVQQFILAMVLHPDIQRRARLELESVVGMSRLPTLADRSRLPYVDAVLKEVLRWQPAVPLSLPHCTDAEDTYRGYRIPKGSIVIGNAWRILHDPGAYPDPMAFKPERFLHADGTTNPAVRDPTIACFGFGRRVCPGRFMSTDTLFRVIACVLHTFEISPALDHDGQPIVVEPSVKPGLIAYPLPFTCSIRPHSLEATSLIQMERHT
ncbi:cytochrome P450 [Panus rudis PR-1116 ss-1]|nr:cytochrome P450 [Panus rudis PR-1116 ss-1]